MTTSPIWNKTKMRDTLRRVNQEQDKLSTFQTPAPNPRFGALSAFQKFNFSKGEAKQTLKLTGGIVMKNIV